MQNRAQRERLSSFLATVIVPRVVGALIPMAMYLDSTGFRIDTGGIQSRMFFGAFGFVMLHTRAGRRLVFAGWLLVIAILALGLKYVEFNWDTVKALLMSLAMGALWFVDWNQVARPRRQSAALGGLGRGSRRRQCI